MWIYFLRINQEFNIVASGSKDMTAIVWDLRSRSYIRELCGHTSPITHVGINSSNGNITTIAGHEIRMWSINGDLLAATTLQTFGLCNIVRIEVTISASHRIA